MIPAIISLIFYENRWNRHLQKIAEEKENDYPDKRGIETWEQDIARHMRILEKLRAKLPGRKP